MGGLEHTELRGGPPLRGAGGHHARVGRTKLARPAVAAVLCGAAVLGSVTASARRSAARGGEVTASRVVASGHAQTGDCLGCHASIAAEWAGSQHRSSFTDEAFQRAYAIEPLAFCRGCHAPTASAKSMPSAIAADTGVGCTSCHVMDGQLHASPGEGDGPHALVRSESFASADACARCHEFDFPDTALRAKAEPMQLTVAEHASSRFSNVACATCHMPWTGDGDAPHRSHRFDASRDPSMVRAAVVVAGTRTSPTTVQVALAPGIVGHAFPTGDLLRRVAVVAQPLGARAVRPRVRYLARHFDRVQDLPGIYVRKAVTDDRVGVDEGARVVELAFPEAGADPIAWWVVYERVGHPRGRDERAAFVEGSIAIAGGVLPALPAAAPQHLERAAP
jgi:hypothetical protein